MTLSTRVFVSLAFVLILMGRAGAQEAQTSAASPLVNWMTFGARVTSVVGDPARYERYRDLSDGAILDALRWNRENGTWFLSAQVDHLGYDDQRFAASFSRPGRVRGWFTWDQIPLLQSETTRTLFTEPSPGVLTIADALQSAVQATPAALPGVFNANALTLATESRRHIAEGGLEYLPTAELALRTLVRYVEREGNMPFGGSFGHSSLVETVAPIRHTTTDFEAGAEFNRDRLLLRAGYAGSWFTNDVASLVFDNPTRLDDSATASSRGRIALAPSNSFINVNALASVRLPARTRATAYVAIGVLDDAGDPILPHTVNTALVSPALPRSTVDGDARTTAVNLSLVSRPTRWFDVNVRYRSYDYDNRTPEFTITQRVGYDNSVSTLAAPSHTEPFGVVRHTFDADAAVTPGLGVSAGLGYSRVTEDRTHRIFESTADDIVRVVVDTIGNRWFSLRAKYEHGERRGEGDLAEIRAELLAVGEQPGMRHFDIASRDRDRVTLLAQLIPGASVGGFFSVAAGKDDYIQSEFGLRDNTHRVYSVGLDAVPGDRASVGVSYSYERYNALSRSRQANPPVPGPLFDDPARNWATDATDRVHSFIVTAGVDGIGDKVDIKAGYDFNRAKSLYAYITGAVPDRTLPEEVVVPTVLPPPTQLPLVRSQLRTSTLDVLYHVSPRVAVGVAYLNEDYDVSDFTLDAESNQNLVRGSVVLLGYTYRPYTANTVWARMLYRW